MGVEKVGDQDDRTIERQPYATCRRHRIDALRGQRCLRSDAPLADEQRSREVLDAYV
jgi:hypothetical protein